MPMDFEAKKTSKRVPAHWPTDLKYLYAMEYSSSIPADVLRHIKGSQMCRDKNHPACGEMGLFANRKIPPHTRILDYLGEVHSDDRQQSNYDLSLYRSQDGSSNIGIDASCMGNEARFINDYRGIKSKPNALFKEVRTVCGELRMSVWSDCTVIRKGDEILVSYGKSWWRARQTCAA